MKKIEYIYDLIDKSNVTLIGYSFGVERIKDELISKIPCYKLGEISSSFSIKSYLRDFKLEKILNNEYFNFKYLVFDINDIRTDVDIMSRIKTIKGIINSIREDMYKVKVPYKLIISCPVFKSIADLNTFTGGTSPLYLADFAFVIQDPKLLSSYNIKVIKNRHDIERDILVSIDDIKQYNYLVNQD